MLREYLTTSEVADYLRLKERKVYDLVRQGQIPCSRAAGKLLFPRQRVDMWLLNHLEGDQAQRLPPPLVLAGSQDPLLEWALRESGSEVALLCHGSWDGVRRLVDGKALLAGVHLLNPDTGGYNDPAMLGLGGMRDLVIIHWARRRQGLLLASNNPLDIHSLKDIARQELTVAHRQLDAGAAQLLKCLLEEAAIDARQIGWAAHASQSEDDLALSIRQGDADVGLGVEAAARRQQLAFIPLRDESFDLVMPRRSYFEPAIQTLMSFTRQTRFRQQAESLGGYDISQLGCVLYNA